MYANKADEDNNKAAPLQLKQQSQSRYFGEQAGYEALPAKDERPEQQVHYDYQQKADQNEAGEKLKTMQLLADEKASRSSMVPIQAMADQFAKNQSVVYQLAKEKTNPKIESIFPATSSSNTLQLKKAEPESEVIQMVRYDGRKPPFLNAVAPLQYVEDPVYRNSGVPLAGGGHSTAVIGPNVAEGNRADPDLPGVIRQARVRYAPNQLKAGHLLNAQFGGDGYDANNLTVLSAAGNRNHSRFDNPVIRAVQHLRNAYEILWRAGIDISTVNFGISVSVRVVTDNTWPGERAIFTALDCDAELHYAGPQLAAIRRDFQDDRLLDDFNARINTIEELCQQATAEGQIANPVARPPRIRALFANRLAPIIPRRNRALDILRVPIQVRRQRERREQNLRRFVRNPNVIRQLNLQRDLRAARRNARRGNDG